MNALSRDDAALDLLEPLALAAGRRIMEIVRAGFSTETKPDASPVTQADREAEAIILSGLRRHFPGVAIVAEEEAACGMTPSALGDCFFLVDPLDGTREFVHGGTDFTVNIALVRDGLPAIGIVYAPAMHALFRGRVGKAERVSTDADHRPLDRRPITARAPRRPLLVVASRSHNTPETDRFIGTLGEVERVSIGSSLKFCLLAEGEADIYPRFGRTMQWDTAAGDAVLRAAGGTMRHPDGTPFRYGPRTAAGDEPFANPHFVAAGRSPESV